MQVLDKKKALVQYIKTMQAKSKLNFININSHIKHFLLQPRHIEIQILGDGNGNVIHLYERDCSIQKNHQKIIEEAPSVKINKVKLYKIAKQCVEICKKLKYRGAGTFEFLYENEKFYFIEINTRIQVEHPVTEYITGINLVKEQIDISKDKKFNIVQDNIKCKGHSIECRINVENSIKTLLSSSKNIKLHHIPKGPGIKVDFHIYKNCDINIMYDSMIAKIIVHADNRMAAIKKMTNALREIVIDGVITNISLHKFILNDEKFQNSEASIYYLNNILKEKKFINKKI